MKIKISPRKALASVRAHLTAPEHAKAAEVPGTLHAARTAALWLASAVIVAANAAAFAESYRGLFDWARHHNLSGVWAAAFPAQVDTFILVGEIMVFVAAIDGWKARHRAGAWLASLVGLVVSVAGNVGHVGAATLQSHATASIPPLSAFAGLWLGVSLVKRVLENRPAKPAAVAELPDVQAAEVPADAEHAARIALRATARAGNALSQNQLVAKFGITRSAASKLRKEIETPKEAMA